MPIQVELFGIPRQRAGASEVELDAQDLGTLLVKLGDRFPQLEHVCVEGGRLKQGYLANLNGRQFVSDPETILSNGDAVLILSADAGG